MIDFDKLAHDYIDSWNDREQTSRQARLKQLCAPKVRYTDPLADVTGLDQLAATIAAVQEQFPDFVFSLADGIDGHGRQVRFTWELGEQGQEAPVVGFDVATLDEQGRIDRVLGFLDRAPG